MTADRQQGDATPVTTPPPDDPPATSQVDNAFLPVEHEQQHGQVFEQGDEGELMTPEALIAQLLSEEQAQALLALVQHAQQQHQETHSSGSDTVTPTEEEIQAQMESLHQTLSEALPQSHAMPSEDLSRDPAMDSAIGQMEELPIEEHLPETQEPQQGDVDGEEPFLETEKLTAALQSAVQGLVHESLSAQQIAELEASLPQTLYQSLALQLCQAALQGSIETGSSDDQQAQLHEGLLSVLLSSASGTPDTRVGRISAEIDIQEIPDDGEPVSSATGVEMLQEASHHSLHSHLEHQGTQLNLEQLTHTLQVLSSTASLPSPEEQRQHLVDAQSQQQQQDQPQPSSAEYWASAFNAVGLRVPPSSPSLTSSQQIPTSSTPGDPSSSASDFVVVPHPSKTTLSKKDRARPSAPPSSSSSTPRRPEKRPRLLEDKEKRPPRSIAPSTLPPNTPTLVTASSTNPLDFLHRKPRLSSLEQTRQLHALHRLESALNSPNGPIVCLDDLEEATEEERLLIEEAIDQSVQIEDPETGKKETQYTCPRCSLTFTRIYNLKSHVRSHQSFRPFKCSSCSASFSRNHDLTRHERSHTSNKPFSCKFCGKTFSRKDALRRHEKMDLQGKKSHCILPPGLPGTGGDVINLVDLQPSTLSIPAVMHQSHPSPQPHTTPSPPPSSATVSTPLDTLSPPAPPPLTDSLPQDFPPSIAAAASAMFSDISPAEMEVHLKQLQELKKQMEELEHLEALKDAGLDISLHLQALQEQQAQRELLEHQEAERKREEEFEERKRAILEERNLSQEVLLQTVIVSPHQLVSALPPQHSS